MLPGWKCDCCSAGYSTPRNSPAAALSRSPVSRRRSDDALRHVARRIGLTPEYALEIAKLLTECALELRPDLKE